MMATYFGLSCVAFASCCSVVGALHNTVYSPLMAAPPANEPRASSLFSFGSTWHVLGPFQIGTRGMSMSTIWDVGNMYHDYTEQITDTSENAVLF
jgi:hypothetical protein